MVSRPVVIAVIGVGFFLILQALVPKAMALKKLSSADQIMLEGHRTHKRKNYLTQRATDKDNMEWRNGVAYELEPFDADRNPEELSAFIVDYANMIRNDVILLDKSVETRTRKRGNIKVKKYNNQMIPDLPCRCGSSVEWKILGKDTDTFPPYVKTRICDNADGQNTCRQPFVCKENVYNLTILKKIGSTSSLNVSNIELHENLKYNWYAVQLPISVGCTCKSDYISKAET